MRPRATRDSTPIRRAKAVAAGMKYRSTEETCRAILAWWPEAVKLREKVAKEVAADRAEKGLPPQPTPPADRLRAGIPPEKEAALKSLLE